MAGGEVVSRTPVADHMDMLLRKMGEIGVTRDPGRPTGCGPTSSGRLHSVDVATLPYPGVATDYKPFLVTMLSVADGVGIVTENLFSGRFRYVDELRRMGADIRTEGHHAVVRGVRPALGRPGARPRPPRRRRAGPRRHGGRGRDRGVRRRTTSTVATRTWPRTLSSLGADVTRV